MSSQRLLSAIEGNTNSSSGDGRFEGVLPLDGHGKAGKNVQKRRTTFDVIDNSLFHKQKIFIFCIVQR